jgi:cobalt-zinc-cadmium efflux system membrane fusion protein
MKTFKIPSYFIIPFLLLFNSCDQSEANTNEVQNSNEEKQSIAISVKQFESFEMEMGQIQEQELATTITARGHIDVPPSGRAVVSPYYSGFVKYIDILPGQSVKKGEILFTIQNPAFIKMQQEYLEAKEQLNYLKIDFERQKMLADENISSAKNSAKAESDYKVMLVKYQGLQAQLKLLNVSIKTVESGKIVDTVPIYTPISGFITKVETSLGAYIPASSMAVEVTNTDHLHLELQVFEKDVPNITEGQPLYFLIPEQGDKRYEGEVHLVGKSIEGDARTINVHGHINEADIKNLIPGLFVLATIETSKKSAMCLPKSALVNLASGDFILINNRKSSASYYFDRFKVKTGNSEGDWIEILNASELEDKQILIKGAFNLIKE